MPKLFYDLNLFVFQYLAWVQSIKPERLHSLSKSLDFAIRQLTKSDLQLELNELESAAKLVVDEEENKTSPSVVKPATRDVIRPRNATKDSDDSDTDSTDSSDDDSSSCDSSSSECSSSSASSVISVKERSSTNVESKGKPSNAVDKLIDEIDVLEQKMNEVILKNSDAIEESNSPKKKDLEKQNNETTEVSPIKEKESEAESKTEESEPKIEEKSSAQDSLAETLKKINISQ